MRRVLGWTCWISGVGLFVLTGIIQWGYAQERETNLLILTNDSQTKQEYWIVQPRTRPAFHLRAVENQACYLGLDPSGEWAYFLDRGQTNLGFDYTLYRVAGVGKRRDVIVSGLVFAQCVLYWTPDGQWMFYLEMNGTKLELIRVKPDGTDPLNLTEHIEGGVAYEKGERILFSADSQWVYFAVHQADGIRQGFQVSLDGTSFNEIGRDTDFRGLFPVAMSPDYQRMLVSQLDVAGVMRPDGTDFTKFDLPPLHMLDVTWLSSKNMVVIGGLLGTGDYSLFAVSLVNGQVAWTLNQAQVYAVSNDETWLLYGRLGQLSITRWDGTGTVVVDSNFLGVPIGWMEDNQSFLYSGWDDPTSTYLIRQANTNGVVQEIWQSQENAPVAFWLREDWLYMSIVNQAGVNIYRVRPNGRGFEQVTRFQRTMTIIMDEIEWRDGIGHQIGLLAASMVLVLTGFIGLRGRRKSHGDTKQ